MARPAAPVKLPLLERIGGGSHGQALDAAGLRDAVGRELLRLLNQRSAVPDGAALHAPLSVPDYGLPDWSALYAANADDRLHLAQAVVRAIATFEPRLQQPAAHVGLHPGGLQQLLVQVRGTLALGAVRHPVSYGIGLSGAGAALLGPGTLA